MKAKFPDLRCQLFVKIPSRIGKGGKQQNFSVPEIDGVSDFLCDMGFQV